jgi:hypothetical protein
MVISSFPFPYQHTHADATLTGIIMCFGTLLLESCGDARPLRGAMEIFTKSPHRARNKASLACANSMIFAEAMKHDGKDIESILRWPTTEIANIMTALHYSPQKIQELYSYMTARIDEAKLRPFSQLRDSSLPQESS